VTTPISNERLEYLKEQTLDDSELVEIISELLQARERIQELEKAQEWISVDDYLKMYCAGDCWVYYKGRVQSAHQMESAFYFSQDSNNRFMTECISSVMRINKPAPPKEQP